MQNRPYGPSRTSPDEDMYEDMDEDEDTGGPRIGRIRVTPTRVILLIAIFGSVARDAEVDEAVEDRVRDLLVRDVEPEALPVHGERVFKFVFAKETRVYKDVGQAIANRFVDQNCGDGGVHAAATPGHPDCR